MLRFIGERGDFLSLPRRGELGRDRRRWRRDQARRRRGRLSGRGRVTVLAVLAGFGAASLVIAVLSGGC